MSQNKSQAQDHNTLGNTINFKDSIHQIFLISDYYYCLSYNYLPIIILNILKFFFLFLSQKYSSCFKKQLNCNSLFLKIYTSTSSYAIFISNSPKTCYAQHIWIAPISQFEKKKIWPPSCYFLRSCSKTEKLCVIGFYRKLDYNLCAIHAERVCYDKYAFWWNREQPGFLKRVP